METFAAGAETRTVGRVLAEERERQGLGRADVAQRLHMSPWQVEALEGGDYDRLPKGTFLRGFVRNYARLLHLEAEPLVGLLPASSPAHKAAGNIVPPSEKIRFEPMGERVGPVLKGVFVALLVLALGLAATYWWLFMKDTAPASEVRTPESPSAMAPAGAPQQVAAAPVPPAETPPPVDAPKDETLEPAGPLVSGPPSAAPAAGTPPAPAQASDSRTAAAVAGERHVVLRFAGESWVEIRDAGGRTLVSKLHDAGTGAEVSGRAPFSIVVGNAPQVQMSVDGRPYDLQPHVRAGGVARLTLE